MTDDKTRTDAAATTVPDPPSGPLPLWLRALSLLPFRFWYAVSDVLVWIAEHFASYRRHVVDAQLKQSFPQLDEAALKRIRVGFYRNFADTLVELFRWPRLTPDDFREIVKLEGVEHARRHLDAGQSVLLLASHNANWEWMLMSLSLELGYPLDAAYKPLHNGWSDRLFLQLRSRFGARMVPAKLLFTDALKRRNVVRAIAMIADQDPVSADMRHFTQFLGQPTAFYLGAEAIAKGCKLPVFFVAMRRIRRGRYRLSIEPLAEKGEQLPQGALIERYARKIEALIHDEPSDWLWSYRRWKVKKSVYD